MNGPARTCAALAAGVALAVSMTGCGPMCRTLANEEIRDLKQIVSGLLPDSVAITLAEENDCDSGYGGFLTFTASRTMTSEQVFEKFLAKGWSRIDQPYKEGCVRCVDGLDGVSTEWGSEVVYLTISNSEDDSTMDILAAFQ
ncbi:hypothetical protein [Nonomuraea sp. 10N515B]|uniref:hypothetical protein n=1 Tax=Nonomuraea sp. 10N515B TaxID=3457422 RepID=UPI003FCC8E20